MSGNGAGLSSGVESKVALKQDRDANDNVLIVEPEPVFIDLTDDDYEPLAKKIVLINGGAGSSSATVQSEQPCTSSSVQLSSALSSSSGCFICGTKTIKFKFVDLVCNHRFCYQCFILALQNNKGPLNFCPLPRCRKDLSDDAIKKALLPGDYTCFLEHLRDNLRRALNIGGTNTGTQMLDDEDNDSVILLDDSIRTNTELHQLQNLHSAAYVANGVGFECPICFENVPIAAGVVLKDCLHTFCKLCIEETIKHADDPIVSCPYINKDGSCESFIQESEIRALVTPETFELHLSKGLQRAETNLENIFHCKAPDCIGFIQHEPGRTAFPCPVCEKVNCIKCNTIHEEKTCEQHQFDLVNDVKNQRELTLTNEAVQAMVANGEVNKKTL